MSTDEALIEKYYGCIDDSFETLYLRYRSRLNGFLRAALWQKGRGHDREIVRDAEQEAWLEVMVSRQKAHIAAGAPGTFRGGSFKAWLFEIASNKLNSILRKARKLAIVPPEAPILSEKADPRAGSEFVFSELVARCLDALDDERERKAFVLRYCQEFTLEEAGQVLGSSVSTTDRLAKKARDRVRRHLEKQARGERGHR